MESILKENEQVLVITDSGKKFIGLIVAVNPDCNTYFVISENLEVRDYFPKRNIYDSDSIETIKFLVGL